jgi:Uma2 family endonuclease
MGLAPGTSGPSTAARLPGREEPLPPVDSRLIAPETPFEAIDGRVVEAMSANEPHATASGELVFVLRAAVRPEFRCAVDMLTRADRYSDVAPDASVFPSARDPETGGRQLEHLVFEVRDTQPLADVTRKAELLTRRGVRSVFCVEISAQKLLTWSATKGTWIELASDASIDDPTCLVQPIPVRALLNAVEADNAAARSLLAKQNPVLREALREHRAEGHAEGLRTAIVTACELLGCPLDTEQKRALELLDATALQARLERLRVERRWSD